MCVKSGSDFTQVLTRNEVVPLRDAWVVCYIIGYCLLLLSNGGIYLDNCIVVMVACISSRSSLQLQFGFLVLVSIAIWFLSQISFVVSV